MILDNMIVEKLDQGTECPELFDPPQENKTYLSALETFDDTSRRLVDVLFSRSERIAS